MSKVKRKQVTFNIEDEEQRGLLNYALSLDNFSGRMKKLLREDYERFQRLQQLERGGIQMTIGSTTKTVM